MEEGSDRGREIERKMMELIRRGRKTGRGGEGEGEEELEGKESGREGEIRREEGGEWGDKEI